MNKRTISILAAAATLLGATSLVAVADTYTNDRGERIECHQETVQANGNHPIAGPVIGAVVGGVIGHQIGGGKGKDIATGVGAAGGAVAGSKINENRVEKGTTTQNVCHKVG